MSKSPYRCLVVDDEALARDLIASHLSQLDQFELVGACASAIEASRFLSANKVDLLFLDIEMPVLKGTDFYQGLSHKPKVIFTTAYRDYALDGFELEAIDYLLKPIVFARFFKAIERFLASQPKQAATSAVQSPDPEYLFVRCDRKDIKLTLADVFYIQGLKDYIRIHTASAVYTVKETMNAFSERLGQDFVRVHRSYIVNRRQVTALARQDVEIGDIEIPIGETYREAALKAFRF